MQNELVSGAFVTALKRTNSQLRNDRAAGISDTAETMYKRTVEDLRLELKKLQREQESILDLGTNNKNTIIMESDFDVNKFILTDLDIAMKIVSVREKLMIAEARYDYLFKSGPEAAIDVTLVHRDNISND